MSQIVQARCPSCKQTLRIPASWLQQPMRCKHCQQVFQATSKAPVPSASPALRSGLPNLAPASIAAAPAPLADEGDFNFTSTASPGIKPSYPYRRKKGGNRWILVTMGLFLLIGATAFGIIFGPQLWEQGNELWNQQFAQNEDGLTGKDVSPGVEPEEPEAKSEENSGKKKEEPPEGGTKKKDDTPIPPMPPKVNPKKNEGPKNNDPPKVEPEPKKPDPNGGKVNTPPDPPTGGIKKPKQTFYPQKVYPRRALAISINDYLLANSLEYGEPRGQGHPGSSPREVLNAFGNYDMKFPNTQLFELSDSTKSPEMPIKAVIENAISKFLSTSRGQDRVVVFFSGHVSRDDGENVYLVPIEGDLDDPATLIPLVWVYDQLKKCPARQKLLILDVCRYNPARGFERRGGEALEEATEKKISQPPEGVQVWLACSVEQQSYELNKGSLFQEALCAAMWDKWEGIPHPADPLPLDQLVPKVNQYLEKRLPPSQKQVSKLYGKEPQTGANFNPEEAPAAKFTLMPPKLASGFAGKGEVMSVIKEINAAPPPRADKAGAKDVLRYETLPPFSAKVLAEYQIDGYADEDEFLKKEKEFPLRAVVVRTKQTLKENAEKFSMKEFFGGNSTAQVKASVKKEQADPAKALFFLQEALAEMEDTEKYLEAEPSKRWKAHYHYVMARLKARLIYVTEYNFILGQIRTDSLPELPKGAAGYRVASVEKNSAKTPEVREWSKQLKKHWQKIITDYPDTPWALMARREKDTSLGLEWRASQN